MLASGRVIPGSEKNKTKVAGLFLDDPWIQDSDDHQGAKFD